MGNIWTIGWKTITNKLSKIAWEEFRQHKQSVIYTEGGGEGGRKFWSGLCNEHKIDPKLYKDTQIGKPTSPILYDLNGVKVTANSCRFAYSIYRLNKFLPTNKKISVLEVGGGYGSFAEQLCRQYKVTRYHLIDVPVMQTLQGYYMIKSGYGHIISFDPPKEKVDLIVSIQTLGEMPPEDVEKYIKLFEASLKPETGLLYLVQATEKVGHVLTAWDDYPFSPNWDLTKQQYPRRKQIECFGRLKTHEN